MVTEIDPKRRNKLGGLVENFQNAIFSTDLKGLNYTVPLSPKTFSTSFQTQENP